MAISVQSAGRRNETSGDGRVKPTELEFGFYYHPPAAELPSCDHQVDVAGYCSWTLCEAAAAFLHGLAPDLKRNNVTH